jgi:hypothetical protein
MIFVQRAPLQQHLALVIEDENRKCTVQLAFAVRLHFLFDPDRVISFID